MNKKAFSLVEIIIVLAILAVVAAVLIPSFVRYIDETRTDKDEVAMATLTDAVLLAMADENVYNEVLEYVCVGNYSCYVDSGDESVIPSENKIITEGQDVPVQEYMFSDEARDADGQIYRIAGNMRGMTLTFEPQRNGFTSKINIKDAIVNKFLCTNGVSVSDKATITTIRLTSNRVAPTISWPYGEPNLRTTGTLSTMEDNGTQHYLYQKVKSVVGETITLESETYRHSEYTIFIHIEDTRRDQIMKNPVQVYGQWNGTNLD